MASVIALCLPRASTMLALISATFLVGCPSSSTRLDAAPLDEDAGPPTDARPPEDSGLDARVDAGCPAERCDDGVFCNGAELCELSEHGPRCVAGVPPCAAHDCDEVLAACCADADGDLARALPCGSDCDDANPSIGGRYAFTDVCDAAGIDEDCRPETLGRDDDYDGHYARDCCNLRADGSLACGDDCDDSSPLAFSGAPEQCNLADDDCDGAIDEGLPTPTRPGYVDCDLDGWGAGAPSSCAPGGASPVGCGGNWSTSGEDCDDSDPGAHPFAEELCNGRDDDCDAAVDRSIRDDDGDGYPWFDCDSTLADCDEWDPMTHPGADEPCDYLDHDCNGALDGPLADAWCARTLRASSATCVLDPHPRCRVDACAAPFLDCEPSVEGCETDPAVSTSHCGACGRSCGLGACVGGTCVDPAVTFDIGFREICAVRASGQVLCWTTETAPALRVGITTAVRVEVGDTGGCALLASGEVACWGIVVGSGPVLGPGVALVAGVSAATDLAVGYDHACAVLADRRVVCWGRNASGQLGDGTVATHAWATQVLGLDDAVSIAAAYLWTCAVRATGAVVCWGEGPRDFSGAPVRSSLTPEAIVGVPAASQIGAAFHTACVETTARAVWCWGNTVDGVSGSLVPGADGARGVEPTCGARPDGSVVCWGVNGLGDGSPVGARRADARPVAGIGDAISISAEEGRACALRAGGSLWCWGVGGPLFLQPITAGMFFPSPVEVRLP